MEHVTRHLIYSRFWNNFLYDIGAIPFAEPYLKRTAQGLVLGEDGQKMSKSIGNVVNPNDIMDVSGADTLRLYIMFMGDYEMPVPWSSTSINGCKRFLDRVYNLLDLTTDEKGYSKKHSSLTHRLIKKVGEDIEAMKFNTAIAAMMSYVNEIYADGYITKDELTTLVSLLYSFAPHIAEEVNEKLGNKNILAESKWFAYDKTQLIDAVIELPVQINGKMKGVVNVAKDATVDDVIAAILADPSLALHLKDKIIKKSIYVPMKIANFII
jgi:leucyl-tRNA synthetase